METQKRALRRLCTQWKKRANEYEKAMLSEDDLFARARYEGIAKGLRWCVIDIDTMLKAWNKNEPNPNNP